MIRGREKLVSYGDSEGYGQHEPALIWDFQEKGSIA